MKKYLKSIVGSIMSLYGSYMDVLYIFTYLFKFFKKSVKYFGAVRSFMQAAPFLKYLFTHAAYTRHYTHTRSASPYRSSHRSSPPFSPAD